MPATPYYDAVSPNSTPIIRPSSSSSIASMEDVFASQSRVEHSQDNFHANTTVSLVLELSRDENRVFYSRENDKKFLDWWMTTPFARDWQTSRENNNKRTFPWGNKKASKAWECFIECAEIRTGKPKAQCKNCNQYFKHPSADGSGPSTLSRHLTRANCQADNGERITNFFDVRKSILLAPFFFVFYL